MNERVLVTGGAGFVGSHLCGRLLEHGYHVFALDNLQTGSLQNIAHLASHERFDFIEHDVCARTIEYFKHARTDRSAPKLATVRHIPTRVREHANGDAR
jgi:nucleoside-diphosphate-sugar epimerase